MCNDNSLEANKLHQNVPMQIANSVVFVCLVRIKNIKIRPEICDYIINSRILQRLNKMMFLMKDTYNFEMFLLSYDLTLLRFK